ncbi:MAG: aminoacyl-histidine dipeptidase, partial [Lachnospiraceae bacterium]|nr:aminoacyl-histidine dipeptidase [Lachnospiraceae bacterium]
MLFFFEELSKIPRGSGNTRAVSDYVAGFARDHGLKVVQDDSNNVIVYLPATAGFEGKEKIMLQGHLDMVCEKETDCAHDFLKDPLDLYIENGKLAAKGTTLGG